jgi:hypothetical protein
MTSVLRLAHGSSLRRALAAVAIAAPLLTLGGVVGTQSASAAQAAIPLGTAASFAVLASTTVTNTGNSGLTGDLGVTPGTAITGFPPGTVTGTIYEPSAVASPPSTVDPGLLTTAKGDSSTAYTDAMDATPSTPLAGTDNQLGGETLVPGVYSFGAATTANLTGTVTLDGSGVYIFQASSSLVTASSSVVALEGGAAAGCVFWQVGSQATLGGSSLFVGTILAGTSVVAGSGATVVGRLLAQTAAVNLDDTAITAPAACAAPASAPSTTTTEVIDNATGRAPTGAEVTGASFHDTATVSGGSGTPTGSVTYVFYADGTCSGTPESASTALTLTGGVAPPSPSTGALGPGNYSYRVTYSGDATYGSGTSACEPLRVLAPTPPPTTPPPTTPRPTTPPPTTPPVTTPVTPVTPVIPVTPFTAPVATGSGGEIIPVGAPQTGAGGASHAPDSVLVALGGIALIGAGVAMGQAIRRRRLLHTTDGLGDSEPGEDA